MQNQKLNWMTIKDVINMARIIGVPALCGSEGMDFEREQMKMITRAKAQISIEDRAIGRTLHEKKLLRQDIANEHDPSATVNAVAYQVVKKIQTILDGHLIRRTIQSKRWDGKCINENLLALIHHNLLVMLPEKELKSLDEELTALTDG